MPNVYGVMPDGSTFHLTVANGPFILRSPQRRWRFEEDHWHCPWPVDKHGEVLDRYWGEHNVFWAYYSKWVKAGRPVADEPEGDFYICRLPWLEPKP